MLELVHKDPRGWLQTYLRIAAMPARAPVRLGCIYVLQVTGAAPYVKLDATSPACGQ